MNETTPSNEKVTEKMLLMACGSLKNLVLVTNIGEDPGTLATHRGMEKAGCVPMHVQLGTNTK